MTPFRVYHSAAKQSAVVWRNDVVGPARVLKVFRGRTAKRRATDWMDALLVGWFSRERENDTGRG